MIGQKYHIREVIQEILEQEKDTPQMMVWSGISEVYLHFWNQKFNLLEARGNEITTFNLIFLE